MDNWGIILFGLLAAGLAVFAVVKFWPKPPDLSADEKNTNAPIEESGDDGDKESRPNGMAENTPSEPLSDNPRPPPDETNGDEEDKGAQIDPVPENSATKQEAKPDKPRKKGVKPGTKSKNKTVDTRNKPPTTPPRKSPPELFAGRMKTGGGLWASRRGRNWQN